MNQGQSLPHRFEIPADRSGDLIPGIAVQNEVRRDCLGPAVAQPHQLRLGSAQPLSGNAYDQTQKDGPDGEANDTHMRSKWAVPAAIPRPPPGLAHNLIYPAARWPIMSGMFWGLFALFAGSIVLLIVIARMRRQVGGGFGPTERSDGSMTSTPTGYPEDASGHAKVISPTDNKAAKF